MRILHVSDTHGTWPELIDPSTYDIIVHSGDGLPNRTRGNLDIEPKYQANWVGHHAKRFKRWIGDKPFLYLRGNHDFIDPCSILRAHGIEARGITNTRQEVNGVGFYGFPFVPYMCGEWFGELQIPEMASAMSTVVERCNAGEIDVLVTHAPIYGLLDRGYGEHCGNRVLNYALDYQLQRMPRALLHGHIHEDHGLAEYAGMVVSNAATTQRIVELSR